VSCVTRACVLLFFACVVFLRLLCTFYFVCILFLTQGLACDAYCVRLNGNQALDGSLSAETPLSKSRLHAVMMIGFAVS